MDWNTAISILTIFFLICGWFTIYRMGSRHRRQAKRWMQLGYTVAVEDFAYQTRTEGKSSDDAILTMTTYMVSENFDVLARNDMLHAVGQSWE